MSTSKLMVTRKQLAEFLSDPEAIKTFERLISIVDGLKDGSPIGDGWDIALTGALTDFEVPIYVDGAETMALVGAGIIESGSNANGSYIKFSDGTQRCRIKISLGGQQALANYSATHPSGTWTYPCPDPFMTAPHVWMQMEGGFSAYISTEPTPGATSAIWSIYNQSPSYNVTFNSTSYVDIFVEGKWK